VSDFTDEDDALLAELGVEVEAKPVGGKTPREERIIAGFEAIQRFVDVHGRAPAHGEGRDIFERLYAVRLDRLRVQEECRTLLTPLDRQGLLGDAPAAATVATDELDDDALLAELGVKDAAGGITNLQHVRSAADKRAADEIATRKKCEEFGEFRPLFEAVKKDLEFGARRTRPLKTMDQIQRGQWFIVGGQIAYVADIGKEFITDYDRRDSRLRVVYDNGTESDVLLRSLQRALHKDPAGRLITELSTGPLFASEPEDGDQSSGTIYVLRSKSGHPTVVAHRELLHKIGVTGGEIDRRFSNARLDPTFLMSEVEVVATYKLANINRTKLENLIHRIFGSARLDIEIKDRFGNPVVPREWFLVPIFVIDEAVTRIKDGTITDYRYDPLTASLVKSTA